jgi:hypothetical protein
VLRAASSRRPAVERPEAQFGGHLHNFLRFWHQTRALSPMKFHPENPEEPFKAGLHKGDSARSRGVWPVGSGWLKTKVVTEFRSGSA